MLLSQFLMKTKKTFFYNIFLEKKLYMNYVKNTFLYKILIIWQANQKRVTSVIIGFFLKKDLSFNHKYAI